MKLERMAEDVTRGYAKHRVVGSVRLKHSMNGGACRARWKMIVWEVGPAAGQRGYHCDPCKVGIGESAPNMFRGIEVERRREGRYKWPRRTTEQRLRWGMWPRKEK